MARALPAIDWQLRLFDDRLSETPYLAGSTLSLANLHVYPMMRAVQLTPEGDGMIARRPALTRWLDALVMRDSIRATAWPVAPSS